LQQEREIVTHLSTAAHDRLAEQHGVVSVGQLIEAGFTHDGIKRLESVGSLRLVLRGVYRSPSTPWDELQRCAAICLTRPDVAIGGPTAGRLWESRCLPKDRRIHIVAPPASNPAIAPWVVAYRTQAIHPHDVVDLGAGIRVTSRARTALDLARWLSDSELRSVIEQAMHDGRLSADDMRRVAVDWISPQRPWLSRFLRLLDDRVAGGPAESHPEVEFAIALRRHGVRGIVRQHQVILPDYGRVRFDLAIPSLRWAIELDIHPRHRETAGRRADRKRDQAATSEGWLVTRIDRDEYELGFADAVENVVRIYRSLLSSRSIAS
jgi:very-short-patch-repair endonuclease